MFGERAGDFVLRLVQVHVHWAIELAGEDGDLAEGRIRHRVGRVRREAEAE